MYFSTSLSTLAITHFFVLQIWGLRNYNCFSWYFFNYEWGCILYTHVYKQHFIFWWTICFSLLFVHLTLSVLFVSYAFQIRDGYSSYPLDYRDDQIS